MTDLQRVYDSETVQSGPFVHGEPLMDLEEINSELSEGTSLVVGGSVRMARALEHARVKGILESKLQEVGLEKSQGYKLCELWRVYGKKLLDGSLLPSIEGLTVSHLTVAMKAEDPIKELEQAQDNRESVRQMEARLKGDEEPERVERAEVEDCPHCRGSGKVFKDTGEAAA